MKLDNVLKWGVLALGILIVAWAFKPEPKSSGFDYEVLGATPVLDGGRVKPLDTVARTSLLILSGKQTWKDSEGERRSAIEWLTHVLLAPEKAREYKVFRIDHPDVTGLLGVSNEEQQMFSFAEIVPHYDQLNGQISLVNEEPRERNPYEQALVKLGNSLNLYNRLSISALPPPLLDRAPLQQYQSMLALRERAMAISNDPGAADADLPDEERLAAAGLQMLGQFFNGLAHEAEIKVVPPPPMLANDPNAWQNIGESGLFTLQTGVLDKVLSQYAELGVALQAGDADGFNSISAALQESVFSRYPTAAGRTDFEHLFNHLQPFVVAMSLYVLVFLVTSFSWLSSNRALWQAGFWLLLLAVVVHTFGLLARMYIQERPPVTNLYSSAVFVGWFSAILAAFLEKIFRNGFGSAMAAVVGFCTLIIAQNLGTQGDTLEMMRAVLDSNFWLATHVITISIGYSATFLAGALGVAYILGERILSDENRRALPRMAYGIACFALLFSFVGTVLGGIWADQSWGRFWGWDPKENGAMMIVLWLALVLHARWGRLVSPMGLMQLMVGGNIITAWSWFGTNLLGVGLHSYGFTESGFTWMMAFIFSQLLIIGMGFLLNKDILRRCDPS